MLETHAYPINNKKKFVFVLFIISILQSNYLQLKLRDGKQYFRDINKGPSDKKFSFIMLVVEMVYF